jgi:hypothetical protein
MLVALRAAAVILLSIAAFAGTPGSFRGILYKGTDTKPGWWYVVGRNDSMRLVYAAKAQVTYADEVRDEDRKAIPSQSLRAGAEVRVTAEQDGHGAWRATEIEILSVKGTGDRAPSGVHSHR